MNHMPLINADNAILLSNRPDCATLTPVLERTIGVEHRCRNNRTTRPAATVTKMREVQCP